MPATIRRRVTAQILRPNGSAECNVSSETNPLLTPKMKLEPGNERLRRQYQRQSTPSRKETVSETGTFRMPPCTEGLEPNHQCPDCASPVAYPTSTAGSGLVVLLSPCCLAYSTHLASTSERVCTLLTAVAAGAPSFTARTSCRRGKPTGEGGAHSNHRPVP